MLQSDSINGGNLSVVKGNEDMQNMQTDTMHTIQSSPGNNFIKKKKKTWLGSLYLFRDSSHSANPDLGTFPFGTESLKQW